MAELVDAHRHKIKYEVMIKDLIEKLQVKKDYHERMGVIYMWVKQEHITKSMFIELIEEVQKMKATNPLSN